MWRVQGKHFSTVSMCARGTCQPCEHATTTSWTDCRRQFRAVWVPSTSTRLPLTARDRAGQTLSYSMRRQRKPTWTMLGSLGGLRTTSRHPGNTRWKNTRVRRTVLNRRALRCFFRVSLSDPSELGTWKTTPS